MLTSIRRFAWFVIKSPQRKWVGWGSIFTDLRGFMSRIFVPKTDEIIWICVGNYNRSQALLQNLVSSLATVDRPSAFGLSVVDCNSSDVEKVETEIKKIWPGPLIINQINIPFSRSLVFNKSIQQASGNNVFVCDADMRLPKNLDDLYRRNVRKNSAWFPICQWQIEADKADWRWFTEGTGIFGATKKQLEKTGYYNEEIKTWGKEDWDLFFRFYKAGIAPFRSRTEGLYHSWHPPTKPADFVKMF